MVSLAQQQTIVNITKYLDRIQSSFWFVPVVMAAGADGLALGTVAVNERTRR